MTMKRINRKLLAFLSLLLLAGLSHAQNCNTGEFQWPVTGPTGGEQSDVGPRIPPVPGASEFHRGLDFAVSTGTPVMAAGGGVVESAFYDDGGGGNVMIVRHPNGTRTRYMHLDSFVAREGDSVEQGQQIAVSGSTGRGSGPHLHFEIESADGNRAPMVNGKYWDKAAGLTNGQQVRAGDCIGGIAAAGLSPGGQVAGDPNQGSGTPPNTANGNTGGNGNSAGGGQGGSGSQAPANFDPNNPPPLPQSPFDPTNVDLDTLLPTPKEWIKATTDLFERFNLAKNMNSLGFVLLFAGFVYGLVNATYFYRSDQYFTLFGRLIIAAGLIWGSPKIAEGGLNMWESIYNNLQTRVASEAITTLEGHINTFSPIIKDWAVTSGTLSALGAVAPKPFGIDVVKPVADMAQDFTRQLFTITVLMGSIYGIFFLAIYVSMLMMLLAGILLPILAAFLVLPGMLSWFSRWLSMVVLSLSIIVVLPFMLHVVVSLGVSKPVETLTTIAEGATEQINWLTTKAETENPGWTAKIWEYGTYIASMTSAALTVSGNLAQIFIQWVFGLIILAIGVLAGIYLLQQIPSLLRGFIGGVAGSAAQAVSGGAIAGLAIGGAAAIAGGQAGTEALGSAVAKTAALPAGGMMRPATQAGGSRDQDKKPKETEKKS
jgi:hypothetical protein